MPFSFDFTQSDGNVHTVQVEPSGWVSPLTVEYTVAQAHRYDPTLSVIWKVKGTNHCFTIGEHRLNIISNGNYKEHFKKALEGFRIDYLSWFTSEEYENCKWRDEYKIQFDRFILPESSQGNESQGKKN